MPLPTNVQQSSWVWLVRLEVSAECRPEGSQSEVVIVEVLDAGVYITSHQTSACDRVVLRCCPEQGNALLNTHLGRF